MKKIMYMAVAAIAALSSCSSEDIAQSSNGNNGETKVFTATIEGDAASRSTYDATNKKALWETTDIVSINGVKYQAQSGGAATTTFAKASGETASDAEAPYYAFFADGANTGTGSWDSTNKTFTLPASYNYAAGKFNMPMYAYSESSTELSFKNLCGVLAIKVPSTQMSSVSKIIVTSDQQLNGAFTATADGVLTFSGTEADANKKITLTVASGGTGDVYYIPVPAGNHNFVVVVSDGTTAKSMATSSAVTIERNKIYNISFSASNILPSKFQFTVASGKTVQFTKGNLYWDGTNSVYHLEATQYDSPNNTTSGGTYSESHVAHFFYSKTETISRNKTYLDNSTTASDKFWCNESNKIEVDGTSDLYVLTRDEWAYLIGSTSPRSESLRKYNVTVAGKSPCLVIAPDGFNGTIAGSYSAEEWAIAEATYGLVCLPAAGGWDGSSFYDGGTYGYYWSATPYSGNADDAYGLYFYSGNVYTVDYYRGYGRSVRLVR